MLHFPGTGYEQAYSFTLTQKYSLMHRQGPAYFNVSSEQVDVGMALSMKTWDPVFPVAVLTQ